MYWKVSSYNTEIQGLKNAKSLQKEKGRGKYHIIKIDNSNEIRFFINHTRNQRAMEQCLQYYKGQLMAKLIYQVKPFTTYVNIIKIFSQK